MKARDWQVAVAIAFGIAVMTAGAVELGQLGLGRSPVLAGEAAVWLFFLVCIGAAVGVARFSPDIALGAAWAAGLTQVLFGVPVLFTELALVVVLFAAARWGRPPAVVFAGVSAAVVPVVAVSMVGSVAVSRGLGGKLFFEFLGATGASARGGRMLLLGVALLGIPYLAGLTLRYVATARHALKAREAAEGEAQQAQEIARLREEQNQFARDVHDVVGHSLTVILAQAESAQFVDDPARLKQTMQTIATSARTSLQDVRQVLTPGAEGTALRTGGLEELIESVRGSGHQVVSTEVGDVRPLPPELAVVAYRVLQEMLTNAIKHGRRDQPVFVELGWSDQLVITVRNAIDGSATTRGERGQGIDGMRRRVESVGGRFEVHHRDELQGPMFMAVAAVPVRPSSGGS